MKYLPWARVSVTVLNGNSKAGQEAYCHMEPEKIIENRIGICKKTNN